MNGKFAHVLEEWYETNRRDLPWRNTTDPYRIWISEIILQQTRVAQGYKYFMRFVERFPDVQTLAEASEDEVLKHWQGLGYYSRARNLHVAARTIVEQGGYFPKTYAEIRKLKGIGDYTAAAILSFAFNLPYAVVDGNVYRVLSRWMGIETPIDTAKGKKLFAELAQELLDKAHPAIYNQAIMDFGALQCTPHAPDCIPCPLLDSCVANAKKTVNKLPVKAHKTQTTNRFFHYIYVNAGDYTYIHKRSSNDIWKSLYEIPLIESPEEWTDAQLYDELLSRRWIATQDQHTFRTLRKKVKHVLSHQIIYANLYEVILPDDTNSFTDFQRIRVEEMERYAVPRLVSQLISQLLETHLSGTQSK